MMCRSSDRWLVITEFLERRLFDGNIHRHLQVHSPRHQRHRRQHERAAALRAAAKKLGAKVTNVYWTLGEYDGLLILEAPDDETATSVLLHLAAAGNVHTTTCRAFTAAEMDKIVAKVHVG